MHVLEWLNQYWDLAKFLVLSITQDSAVGIARSYGLDDQGVII
jgi:hypothetical protein